MENELSLSERINQKPRFNRGICLFGIIICAINTNNLLPQGDPLGIAMCIIMEIGLFFFCFMFYKNED